MSKLTHCGHLPVKFHAQLVLVALAGGNSISQTCVRYDSVVSE